MLRLIGAVSSCISRSFSISSLSVSVYFRSITTYLPDLQLFGDRPLLRLASNLLQGHPAHNREGVRQILDYKPTVRVQSMSLHDLLLFQCRDFSILHQYSTSVLSMILSITLRIPSSSAASPQVPPSSQRRSQAWHRALPCASRGVPFPPRSICTSLLRHLPISIRYGAPEALPQGLSSRLCVWQATL